MSWAPLHVHSTYSTLDAIPKGEDIAKRCKELGYKSCSITDHGSLGGVVDFIKGCKKHDIRPNLGCEFYVSPEDSTIRSESNGKHSHLCVLAKGLTGWKSLIKASSASNMPEHFYKKPRLDLKRLSEYSAGNLIVFSGHPGSDLCNILFSDIKAAYSATNYDDAKGYVHPDWEKRAVAEVHKYYDLFGKENFWVEIQRIDIDNMPASDIASKILRHVCKKHGFKKVGTPDSHYAAKQDAADQRVVLCIGLKKTMRSIQASMDDDEEFGMSSFFRSNKFYIPDMDEVKQLYLPDEIEQSLIISDLCGQYSILENPMLPQFDCPNGMDANTYIRKLCEEGAQRKLKKALSGAYKDRFEHEFKVISEAGLSPYFLIVQDYCNWARSNDWLVGKGRGSGAGCLISHLLNITDVDPIKHDLLFERFYNAGRNQPGRVSLPDIDCDFPARKRDLVVEYMRRKYGYDRVAQMVTYSRLQGRSALKDVFRVHERCSNDEANRITEFIPDEAAISDELQEMKEENDGESSIIKWALYNNAKELSPWCTINDKEELEGPLALDFAQAIRLEGTKRGKSKHAAGVVISPLPLSDCCPMIYDKKTDKSICGIEMAGLESMGFVKFDILGTTVLDKIKGVVDLMRTGE